KPGVQAECKVDEVHYEFCTPPTYTQSAKHDCTKVPIASFVADKGTFTVTGPCESIIVKGNDNTVSIDSVKHLQVQGSNNHVVAQAAAAVEAGPIPPKEGEKPAPSVDNTINVNKAVSADKPTIGATSSEVLPDQAEHPLEVSRTAIKNECPEEDP